MTEIIEKIVSQGHGNYSPSYFCVHSTSNPGATAANHVTYWGRNPTISMTHLVSDWKEAYHTVPYGKMCRQVGNGNKYVEGIEICEATNREDFMRGIEIAADVVRQRLAAHGWGIDRLITHDMARKKWGGTDHTDPNEYFAKYDYSWNEFVQLVENGDDDMISEEQMNRIAELSAQKNAEYNWNNTAEDGNCYNAAMVTNRNVKAILAFFQKANNGFSGVGDLVACHPYGSGTPESEKALWDRVDEMNRRQQAIEAKLDALTSAITALKPQA